jgi:hypothetical protein
MANKDRFVDELLESALAHRRDAEPRAGLETRILKHLRTAESERGSRKGLWIAGTATAAAVVMVAAFYVARRPTSTAVKTSQAVNAVPAPSPKETLTANSEPAMKAGPATTVVARTRIVRREKKPSHGVDEHHWPSQFPTPAPLSREEKALVRYVQETPPHVLGESLFKRLAESQPTEIKPVMIAPIEIQPFIVGEATGELQ